MKTQHLTYLLVLPFIFLLGLFSCSDDIGENPDIQTSTNYLDLIQGKLESMNMPRPAGSYDYPVYPGLKGGTYDWETIPTTRLKLMACDIPQNLADSMSSQALIQALWEHPYFPEIAEEGNYQAAFDSIIAKTNAYKTLVAPWQPVNFHKQVIKDLLERRSLAKVVEGEEALPDALNVLIAQEVLYGLSYEERKQLAGEVFNPLSSRTLSTSELFILGRLMSQVEFPAYEEAIKGDANLKDFVEQGKVPNNGLGSIYTSLSSLSLKFEDFHNDEYLKNEANIIAATNMERPADSYDYPIYPGMDSWGSLDANWKKIIGVDIPVEMLQEMSTEALLQGIWEYPHLFFISTVFNSLEDGYDSWLYDANIYQEFLKRDDAADCLLRLYRNMDVIHEDALLQPHSLDVVLAHDVYLKKYSTEELKELIELVYQHDILRYGADSPLYYSMKYTSWFLIGRILRQAAYEPFIEILKKDEFMQLFIERGDINIGLIVGLPYPIYETLDSFAKQFLNK